MTDKAGTNLCGIKGVLCDKMTKDKVITCHWHFTCDAIKKSLTVGETKREE